ncbi:hypothetical protein GCM10009632_04860 [Mycolicibacterium alvei]|uniref:Uncharacterized protein n=1 Tax=Mycolicibacterium alvei TaxID=67081 RepID=A0A6N4V1L8_9MYCO|nr:hypothetical protein MALV_56940 [Mycolicibacterium alvei]
MSELPSAVVQNPACGVCGCETTFDDGYFVCEDCQLRFDQPNFGASFLDPTVQPCGARCDNAWHGDHKIQPGAGYDCGACKLPTGHTSILHWTGCLPRSIAS